MFYEVLARLGEFGIYELFRLDKGVGIIETSRVGHPEGIARLTARDIDNGTAHGNLYLFYLVEHQQSQMPVETVHVQSLVEGGSRLEHMILLWCGQEGIKVCTESVVADVAEVVLRPCDILDVETARL